MRRKTQLACIGIAVAGLAYGDGITHETTIAIGLNATRGNSETATLNGSITTALKWDNSGSLDLGLESNYGRQTVGDLKEKNIDNGKLYANGKYPIGRRSFSYLEASARYDDIALINYRTTIGPGLGIHLLKRDALKLLVEAGVSYVFEDVDDVTDNYAALRVSQEYRQTLNESATIWQTLTYLPQAEDFERYWMEAEVGAESALSKRTSLRVVLQSKYDSVPPEGVEMLDTTLVAAIGIKL